LIRQRSFSFDLSDFRKFDLKFLFIFRYKRKIYRNLNQNSAERKFERKNTSGSTRNTAKKSAFAGKWRKKNERRYFEADLNAAENFIPRLGVRSVAG